jgi:hypothetical protein
MGVTREGCGKGAAYTVIYVFDPEEKRRGEAVEKEGVFT